MPLKPLSGGQGALALSTKGFILSREKRAGGTGRGFETEICHTGSPVLSTHDFRWYLRNSIFEIHDFALVRVKFCN